MFEIVSSLLKYVFTLIIYLFILNVIRLIFADIRSMMRKGSPAEACACCLKTAGVQGVPDYHLEETYPLNSDTSIGRSADNGITLDDAFLSANHAHFIRKGRRRFLLQDNSSQNGTFRNGKRLGARPVRLKNGDRIGIGRTEFLFVSQKGKGAR